MNKHRTYAGDRIQRFIKLNHLKLEADLVTTRQITVTYEITGTQAHAPRCPRGLCSRFYGCKGVACVAGATHA